jgi:hypothetical protein
MSNQTNIQARLVPIKNEEKTDLSYDDIDKETKLVELDLRKEFLIGNKQDREERKRFSDNIFKLLSIFLGITIVIVMLAGFHRYIDFELSDTILIALLTTTTANVIGIFLFVVKYIFKANICHHCGEYIKDK